MSTKTAGPGVLALLSPERVTEAVFVALGEALDDPALSPPERNWDAATKQRWSASILEGKLRMVDYWWQVPSDRERLTGAHVTALNIDSYRATNVPGFESGEGRVLGIYTSDHSLPLDNDGLVRYFTDKFRAALAALQPRYALIDHMYKRVYKRKNEDLRLRAWSTTIFGPEDVDEFGREHVLKTPAYEVKELEWGGVWIQAGENPFQASPTEKRAVEKHLDLERVFADRKGLVLRPPMSRARS